jgi:hypothetical protein
MKHGRHENPSRVRTSEACDSQLEREDERFVCTRGQGVTNEPERLARGRAFHLKVQDEWLSETFGEALSEQVVRQIDKAEIARGGRIDVRMIDPDEPMAFVVEVKDSDFGLMTDRRLRRNVARNRLQVSKYGEALLNEPQNGIEYVCLAIVYSTQPANLERRDWIESYLASYMTATYWHDTQRAAPLL